MCIRDRHKLPFIESVGRVDKDRLVIGTRTAVLQGDLELTGMPLRELKKVRGARHLMYDAKDDELFCFCYDGLQVRTKGAWEAKRQVSVIPPETWCHDAKRDCFYTLLRKNLEITEVHTVSEKGATLEKRVLPKPIPCKYNANGRLYFSYCDSNYIILVMRDRSGVDSDANTVHVIDIESLQVVYLSLIHI